MMADGVTLDGVPIVVGQAVMVMVGTACEHHAQAVPPLTLDALQARYGEVMDSEQAAAVWGPSNDPEHTVCVRFIVPVYVDGSCIRGGWFKPIELAPVHIDIPAIRARYGRPAQRGRS